MEFSYEVNHMPYQTGVWFKYTGFRLKDNYDIETKTGEVYTKCYPNSTSFHTMDGSGVVVKDEDVVKIRLTPDSDLEEGYELTGTERIDHSMKMFAEEYQKSNPSGKPYPCDYPDFTALTGTVNTMMEEIVERGYDNDDNSHYINEEVVKAMYGEGFFYWYNKVGG